MSESTAPDVRDVPAQEALPKLRLRRGRGLLELVTSACVRYRPKRSASELSVGSPYRGASRAESTISLPRVVEQAEKLGFLYLGIYEYAGLFGFIPRDAWVSSNGRVRLSGRRGIATGVEGTMSPYILSTMFDDGTAIVTWGKAPAPIPSSDRVKSCAGTGNLLSDVSTHEAQIEAHLVERGRDSVRVIVAESLADSVAMATYFDVYASSTETRWTIVSTRLLVYGMVVGALFLLARWVLAFGFR